MPSKKKIKKKIKNIIDDECVILKNKIKGSDGLEDDLELVNSEFKAIKNAINDKYNLSLRKKDIKECIDVNDIVDLVYEELEADIFDEISSDEYTRIKRYLESQQASSQQTAEESKYSFLKWLGKVGLNWLARKIFDLPWSVIISIFLGL